MDAFNMNNLTHSTNKEGEIDFAIGQINYLVNKISNSCEKNIDSRFIKHEIHCILSNLARVLNQPDQKDKFTTSQRALEAKLSRTIAQNQQLSKDLKQRDRELANQNKEIYCSYYQRQINKLNLEIRTLYRQLKRKHSDLPEDYAQYMLKEKEIAIQNYFK
jgi:hypothetical protein